MKILAIDPGYDRLGVAVLAKTTSQKDNLIFSTCLLTNKKDELNKRLFQIGQMVEDIILTHEPSAIAIETLFFNKNVTTAIGVAQVRGIIIYLAEKHNCRIYEFGPQEIKVAVTGYGKSDKTAVIDMVKRLVSNVPETALDDEYDAIAVGVTCLAQYGQAR